MTRIMMMMMMTLMVVTQLITISLMLMRMVMVLMKDIIGIEWVIIQRPDQVGHPDNRGKGEHKCIMTKLSGMDHTW